MKAGIIGVVILVLIAAGIAFYYTNQSSKTSEPQIQIQTQEEKIEVGDSLAIDSNLAIGSDSAQVNSSSVRADSKYVNFEDIKFPGVLSRKLSLSDTLKRVYFFYADWCPTCRPVDAEIKANLNKIPDDVLIIKVNYNDQYTDDEEKAFAKLHGVTYQHTFVLVENKGDEITRWNGGGLDNLLSKVQ